MILRLVRVMFVLTLCLCTGKVVLAQDSYRQLAAADFRGQPQPGANNAIAHTKCTINFHYEAQGQGDDFRLLCNVRLAVDNSRSWIDMKRVTSQQMLTRILNHEQGHYNISYMEQQELLRLVNRTRFDEYNYRTQANNLFNAVHAKYQQLNENYDIGTENMRNAEQQHSWDVYFQKRITYMPQIAKAGY